MFVDLFAIVYSGQGVRMIPRKDWRTFTSRLATTVDPRHSVLVRMAGDVFSVSIRKRFDCLSPVVKAIGRFRGTQGRRELARTGNMEPDVSRARAVFSRKTLHLEAAILVALTHCVHFGL